MASQSRVCLARMAAGRKFFLSEFRPASERVKVNAVPHDRPEAFLRLFLAHERDLRAYVGAVVAETGAREDIFQDIALALWKSFDRYDGERPFGAWARRIATRRVVDSHRHRSSRSAELSVAAIEAVHAAFDAAPPPVDAEMTALDECLATLPERLRTLLAWCYTERLDGAAMAARAGSTVDAIYQTLSRVRSKLADCIRQRLRLADSAAEAGKIAPFSPLKPHVSENR